MREVIETNAYKKQFKKSLKQNKDSNKLFEVLESLILDIPLEPKYKDHQLKGELKGVYAQTRKFSQDDIFCNERNSVFNIKS